VASSSAYNPTPIPSLELEVTTMRLYQFDLFADYHQFYLIDDWATFDFSAAWTEATSAQMLATIRGGLAVGTGRNSTVPVAIEIHDAEPLAVESGYDRINATQLHISSGKLVVMGCSDLYDDAARIDVRPGIYEVRVYYWDLDSVSMSDLEGTDHYKVVLWPESTTN
jgi:hypothetical protein